MTKVVSNIKGLFDTDTGRLSAIIQDGSSDASQVATSDTAQTGEPVTVDSNGLAFAGGKTANVAQQAFPQNTYCYRRKIGGFVQALTSAYADRTYRSIITVPTAFVGCRIILQNTTLAAQTWSGAIYVASTATATDQNPTSGTFTQVTFSGGLTTATIPAATGTIAKGCIVPGVLISDWIPIESVDRTDGGDGALIMLSGYADSGIGTPCLMSNTGQLQSGWESITNANTGGQTCYSLSETGDVSSSTAFSGTAWTYSTAFYDVEILGSGTECHTILGVGDSIMQGDGGTLKCCGPVTRAAASLTASGYICSAANDGFSSQMTTTFSARLKSWLENTSKPEWVVYHAFSPNDAGMNSYTEAFAVAQCRANMDEAIRLCRVYGVKLILATGIPRSLTGTDEALRVAYNEEVKSKEATCSGVFIADYDSAIADPDDTSIILSAYSEDAMHPNDAGNVVLAGVLAGVISTWDANN